MFWELDGQVTELIKNNEDFKVNVEEKVKHLLKEEVIEFIKLLLGLMCYK